MVFVIIALLFCTSTVWAGGGQEEVEEKVPVSEAVGEYRESPMLTALVDAGELPPLEERLPPVPAVCELLGDVGVYGGPLYTFSTSNGPWEDFGDLQENGSSYVHDTMDGELIPDLMVAWEPADDLESVILTFRKGVKWSDGTPVTVDDFLFMINDIDLHPDVSEWGSLGPAKEAVAISDDTFRVDFLRPFPRILSQLAAKACWGGIQPKHYLSKWHITYNEDADEVAKEEGFSTWFDAFHNHFWWAPATDLDRPVIQPWVLTENSSVQKRLVRNPYYYKVDPAGQQLPYIDEIISPIVDPETYTLKIISGEADVAFMHTKFENYTLYKESEESGGYTVTEVPGTQASEVSIVFNYNTPDPLINQLTKNIKFKAGLSHAINRDEVNRVVHKGMGVPRQATVLPSASYYKPEWAEAYAEYDVALANRYLDESGLTKKNADGFRLRPDNGQVLEWVVEFGGSGGAGVVQTMELVKEYWETVGIKTILKAMEPALFSERQHTGLIISKVRATTVDNHFNLGHWANPWAQWVGANRQVEQGIRKLEDFTDGKLPGVEPPQWAKDYEALFYTRENAPVDSPVFKESLTKAMEMQAENLFMIGTVGMVPLLIVKKNYIYNMPTRIKPRLAWLGGMSEYNEQVYIKK
jgi:peptide/nickel transport system substrate-binding protein